MLDLRGPLHDRTLFRIAFGCRGLGGTLERIQQVQPFHPGSYLDSQVAGNKRPLSPKVDHYLFKAAHNYEPLALQSMRDQGWICCWYPPSGLRNVVLLIIEILQGRVHQIPMTYANCICP